MRRQGWIGCARRGARNLVVSRVELRLLRARCSAPSLTSARLEDRHGSYPVPSPCLAYRHLRSFCDALIELPGTRWPTDLSGSAAHLKAGRPTPAERTAGVVLTPCDAHTGSG